MTQYNLTTTDSLEANYLQGRLPQRNSPSNFYFDTSCRSNLSHFSLTSENRRILKKTTEFTYKLVPLYFNLEIQKRIHLWLNELNWDFPISSVKTVFTRHIFNYLYVWQKDGQDVAYSVCYFDKKFSHIAYVFYDPQFSHSDLPIRLVLQFVIDSHDQNLDYAYLGRFSSTSGYYKRNMPGFEQYTSGNWVNKV